MKTEQIGENGSISTEVTGLLAECRTMVASRLVAAVRVMMDKVDDTLFELADRAENNTIQTRYFDAMREVRLQRASVESAFEKGVRETPARRPTAPSPHVQEVLGLAPTLELSLVEDDELEQSLAVKTMVDKLESVCGNELFVLDKRIGFLVGDRNLEGAGNPLGPDAICNAFGHACESIEADIEIRLIVLKLFDKYVVATMPELYQDLNRTLAAKGVLPQLRYGMQTPVARPAAPRRASTEGDHQVERAPGAVPAAVFGGSSGGGVTGMPVGENVFATLQQLLAASASQPGGEHAYAGGGPAPAVVQGLTLLQRGGAAAIAGAGLALDAEALAGGTANVVRDLRASDMARNMRPLEQATIDIVAMMFDYILDDKHLPDAMKALIGRLQIPVLKVAILDQDFFSKRSHPARRLLDTLAAAAVGAGEENRDDAALYEEAERVVHRILNEFEDDVGIFAGMLAELDEFLAREQALASESAAESADAIQAREGLRLATAAAQEAVSQRLQEREVPAVLREVFLDPWRELLILHYVKDGGESEPWHDALKAMDDLLWSVIPKRTSEERSRLLESLPGLLKRINEGLILLNIDKPDRDRFFSELASLHAAAVRPPAPQGDGQAAPALQPAETVEVPAEDVSAYAEMLREAAAKANRHIFYTAESKPQCKGMGTTLVAVVFHDDQATVAHVGDSRLYRLRGDELTQITKDHSLVQELVDKGFYTPDEAKASVRKNIVTRAMGVEEAVRADVQQQPVTPGDLYLLCSDGLSDLVDDASVQATLIAQRDDLDAAGRALVDMANENGGKDNISVILIGVREPFPAAGEGIQPTALEEALQISLMTDVGRKRSHNEDAIGADVHAGIVVLADGMGGANAGEVASNLAVSTLLEELRSALTPNTGFLDEFDLPDAWGDLEKGGQIEEIIVTDVGEMADAPAVEDEHVALVKQLRIGDWIEFRPPEGTPARARLTWVSPVTGTYLFTNRRGLKVADATLHGLAIEFRRGTAAVIEDVPLLDRAVSSLTERLRKDAARE